MKEFLIPFSGMIKNIELVPDEVFSDRLMGDGFAIELDDDKVKAPTQGIVRAVFPTGHAVAIETKEGMGYLIHIGLEAHSQKDIFKLNVVQGDEVVAGQQLLSINFKKFKKKSKSLLCPIVFTTGEKVTLLKENEYVNSQESGVVKISKI